MSEPSQIIGSKVKAISGLIIGLSKVDISKFFITLVCQKPTSESPLDWQSSLQCGVAGVYITLNISVIASDPGDIAALNVPVASTIVVDSAVADVTSAIGITWAPVPNVAGNLTAVCVPKVPALDESLLLPPHPY